MFLRIISGKLKPGTWDEFERTYREVVAAAGGEREELLGHLRADDVDAEVLGAGVAAPVAVEAGDRVGAALAERAAKDVAGTLVLGVRPTAVAVRVVAVACGWVRGIQSHR